MPYKRIEKYFKKTPETVKAPPRPAYNTAIKFAGATPEARKQTPKPTVIAIVVYAFRGKMPYQKTDFIDVANQALGSRSLDNYN